ncbi:MAG TPA: sugar nucleotide-binding protein [Flavobacteriaceae bacterium]|nr:sugar nucleotide-binding protein [Flavobacteriaceae bacterium]
MKEKISKERILILGASGFIGNTLYRELCGYFKTYGTYFTPNRTLEKNQQFVHFDHTQDDIFEILLHIKPTVIISALRGNFNSQVLCHQHIADYVLNHNCKFIFISSANVFDAYSKYPSYEYEKTLSQSIYGHFKIKIENMLMKLPPKKWAILRLPMVFGKHAPRIEEIKQLANEHAPIEVFPNLIINVTSDDKVAQQIHYIINRKKTGIFHLGSTDLVHHDDFVKEIIKTIDLTKIIYKNVFTTNDERYLAVLPKNNCLPKHLQLNSQEVLNSLLL